MSRRAANITQAEIARAIRAAKQAGQPKSRRGSAPHRLLYGFPRPQCRKLHLKKWSKSPCDRHHATPQAATYATRPRATANEFGMRVSLASASG